MTDEDFPLASLAAANLCVIVQPMRRGTGSFAKILGLSAAHTKRRSMHSPDQRVYVYVRVEEEAFRGEIITVSCVD